MRFVATLVLLLLLIVPARAEEQVWTLTNGRVVNVTKVLSQTPTHVTVRCSEGLLQIDKRKLPPELQEKYPYDSAAASVAANQQREEQARRDAQAARDRSEAERQQPQRQQVQQQASRQQHVRIVNTRPEGPDTAYVTIANDGAAPFEVTKDAFVGVNASGDAFPSDHLTNPRGDTLTKIGIQPNETAEIGVVFRIPEDRAHDIGAVRWAASGKRRLACSAVAACNGSPASCNSAASRSRTSATSRGRSLPFPAPAPRWSAPTGRARPTCLRRSAC